MKPQKKFVRLIDHQMDGTTHILSFALNRTFKEQRFIQLADEFGSTWRVLGDGKTYDIIDLRVHPLYDPFAVEAWLEATVHYEGLSAQ